MKKIPLLLFSIFIASLFLVGQTAKVAAAFDPFEKTCDPETSSASVCEDKVNKPPGDPISGPNGVLIKVANIMAIVGGIIAVVIIMLSGLKMITSTGDSKKLTEGRNALIYAAVGIVVIVMARLILSFILGFT